MDAWISWTSPLVIVVGFASGVLSGMFGVGGAVLTTPGVRVLGASPIMAVGSTVPAILPGAVSGSWKYHRMGLIDWRIALTCGASGSAFAVLGAVVADSVNGHHLMLLTAALGGWSGVSVFRSGRRAAAAESAAAAAAAAATAAAATADPADAADVVTSVPVPGLAAIGAGSGFVAGLLGIGGGVVMMPMFTTVLKLPVKQAVASSLVAVALFSVPALVTHAWRGHIDWHLAVLLMAGVIPGARVGAKLTIGASEKLVRQGFGAFLVILACGYAGGELWSLLQA